MLRNSRQLFSNSKGRFTKCRQASMRLFASEAPHMPSSSSSSRVLSSSASHGRRAAGYITAGTTVGVITCYRSDDLIAHDPYNLGGIVLGVLAHNAVNPTTLFSWPLLLGSLAVGEFLGNGFRHIHQQYSGITISEEERHQLVEEVTEIALHEDKPMANNQDLLDMFENGISAILLQAKTRWMHLCHHITHPVHHHDGDHHESGHHLPDHMSMEELKAAILDLQHKQGEDEVSKEALLQVLSVADINNDGVITFMEFCRALLLVEFAKRDIRSAKSELYFRAIDLHNNGSINQEELLHFAKRLHALGGIPHKDRTTPHWSGLYERPSTPEEICARWMDRFDVNHDGLISREEFHKMAKEIDFGPSFVFTKFFDRTLE